MARRWKFRVIESHEVEVDFDKDVPTETIARDLFLRGHFKDGYSDEMVRSHIEIAAPLD